MCDSFKKVTQLNFDPFSSFIAVEFLVILPISRPMILNLMVSDPSQETLQQL